MGLMDKVKAQATQVAHKAQETAQGAVQAGQSKVDQVQAKRKADSMLRELGAVVYAQHRGTGGPELKVRIDTLLEEITAFESEHGPLPADGADGAGDE